MTISTTGHIPTSVRAEMPVLRNFVPPLQLNRMLDLMRGAEGDYFRQALLEVAFVARQIPKTRETENSDDPLVYLHYFRGNIDVFLTERDIGDGSEPEGLGKQHQAFGYVDLGYGPELGYINLPDLFAAGVELDNHWVPLPVSEVLKGHATRMAA